MVEFDLGGVAYFNENVLWFITRSINTFSSAKKMDIGRIK